MGLEGRRVEVVDAYGETRRFNVGRSTGWDAVPPGGPQQPLLRRPGRHGHALPLRSGGALMARTARMDGPAPAVAHPETVAVLSVGRHGVRSLRLQHAPVGTLSHAQQVSSLGLAVAGAWP